MLKQAIILGMTGRTNDRFAAYHKPLSTQEKLELVASIPGFSGAEIVFPYETGDPAVTDNLRKTNGLEWAAVNVNIKAEPQFITGSASRANEAVRKQAVEMICRAKEFAQDVGAQRVTCCPLSDGYDYLFTIDYASAWKNLVRTFAEAAEYLPHIPLCIEYKFSEIRVHCLLDTAAKTLLLCRDAAVPALGVTIDFGHALYGGENPAQALCLVAEAGVPWYLHLNDNDGRADWDLIGGSRNFLAYVEFLFYAREYSYEDYLTMDVWPRYQDVRRCFARHAAITQGVWELVESLDHGKIRELMRMENTDRLLEMVQQDILRLG